MSTTHPDRSHDHPHAGSHEHGHGGAPHGATRHDHPHGLDHGDEHGHEHKSGLWSMLTHAFTPHSHDAADSIDSVLESSARGIRAVKISLVVLGITAVAQLVIVYFSSSVALLADTIHNFSDALTAVPLWIAFVLGRRAATKRYTYGYGKVEDLAGLFVVAMIALSALIAGWEAVNRLLHPAPVHDLGWVALAGFLGFLGNEAVATFRIREGKAIGSAALVADGYHARTDGFTSLAVLVGAAGVAIGWNWADPVVGLVITVAILLVLRTAARDVFRRLMDGVEPELVEAAENTLAAVPGVTAVRAVRMRWVGHRIRAEAELVRTTPKLTAAVIHAYPSRTLDHPEFTGRQTDEKHATTAPGGIDHLAPIAVAPDPAAHGHGH